LNSEFVMCTRPPKIPTRAPSDLASGKQAATNSIPVALDFSQGYSNVRVSPNELVLHVALESVWLVSRCPLTVTLLK